jgi:hypothetical protein
MPHRVSERIVLALDAAVFEAVALKRWRKFQRRRYSVESAGAI